MTKLFRATVVLAVLCRALCLVPSRSFAASTAARSRTAARPSASFFAGRNGDAEKVTIEDLEKNANFVVRGSANDTIPESVWEDVVNNQPPTWMVMKELLGVGIHTYILAALIVFFLSLNFLLGPGWLGQALGIPGTGSFTETSESLPAFLDLNSPEYRL